MSEETFDDFLAGQGMLEACEDHAIKELIAEQLAAAALGPAEEAAALRERYGIGADPPAQA